MSAAPIRVGVVGLGFMGRTHLAAYRSADAAGFANVITAVCDRNVERLTGARGPAGNLESEHAGPLFDPSAVRAHRDPAALLDDGDVDLVSVCTHTDTHVDLAVAALEAGKHVLVEKPVALDPGEAMRLATAAESAETLCMPAMCMRFWPGWRWLRDAVRSGELGSVRSAVFRRLATRPGWSADFYGDAARNGGALFDLHVHDADFVRWCFGPPDAVFATGTADHLTASYLYDGGPPHVVAEGGWDHSGGYPFRMGYTVVFEGGTADFELGREPLVRLWRDGAGEAVAVPGWTGYDGEVRHLLDAIASRRPLEATASEAVGLTTMLAAEVASLRVGAPRRTSER